MLPKTSAEKVLSKLDHNKRGSNVLQFPLDLDTEGSRNVFLININAVTGSQYNGTTTQKKTENPRDTVAGSKLYNTTDRGAVYQRKDSNSIARLMRGNYVRTDTSIALYMPSTIQTSYDSNWSATDLGLATGTLANIYDMWANNGEGASVLERFKQTAIAAGLVSGQAAAGGTSALGLGSTKELYSMYNQVATNPHTEVLFNGVNNRTFSFTFKMVPRDAAEQEAIRNIVQTIKFHRAPEKDQNSMNIFWRWPSTFDLSFRKKDGEENDWLFKISTCALTQFSVEYGGDGYYGSYEDGSPFFTTMTLGFTEMEILDKNRMLEGY